VPNDLTVYYDGACPLCRTEIGHYQGCAGAERVRFVDLATVRDDASLGPGLDREAAQARFHVREADGRLVSGAAAFARLWRRLPAWRWLGRIVEVRVLGARPVLLLAEAAYRLFLPLRPRLARVLSRSGVLGKSA
jgi:predicted DCC family thiol-disulfide oxidoreductase YuxK